MNEINELDQIPYGITKIRDYENVYVTPFTSVLQCMNNKKLDDYNAASFTARYKPYKRIISLNKNNKRVYKNVSLPEHLFIANFYKRGNCDYILKNSHLLLVKNNKLYPPLWYNVNTGAEICWNDSDEKISYKYKDGVMKYTIDQFWKSTFTLDMKYRFNNFKRNEDASNYYAFIDGTKVIDKFVYYNIDKRN